jgi:hypothetical protein
MYNTSYLYKRKTMKRLTKEQLLGILRHTLTFVGGILITKGIIDEATATEIIGGIITLTGTIWSVLAKA